MISRSLTTPGRSTHPRSPLTAALIGSSLSPWAAPTTLASVPNGPYEFTGPEVVVENLLAAALMFAALTVGIMSGVMILYANTIMPGLRRTDDRTFVGAFQAIDTAIINPLFLATFLGGLLFTGLAAALSLGEDRRSVLPWIVAALVLYLVVVVATVVVNAPLNDGIKKAGAPDRIADLAEVRETFNEGKWVRWNLLRAVLTSAAFGCLLWAIVLFGRAT